MSNEYPDDAYTTFKAYIVAYSSEPGGMVKIRARAINKRHDLFEPHKGFDVMLPAGVVRNFEELGELPQGTRNQVDVEVLNVFVERHGTLAANYDVDDYPPSKFENRNREWYPPDALDP